MERKKAAESLDRFWSMHEAVEPHAPIIPVQKFKPEVSA